MSQTPDSKGRGKSIGMTPEKGGDADVLIDSDTLGERDRQLYLIF